MKIVVLLSDVFLVPIIQSALSNHKIIFVENYSAEESDLFVLDMDHKDSYEVCEKFPEKSVCFGSHKNIEQIKKFKDTGCKSVIPRSLLAKKLQVI